jgi:hypothetical protein
VRLWCTTLVAPPWCSPERPTSGHTPMTAPGRDGSFAKVRYHRPQSSCSPNYAVNESTRGTHRLTRGRTSAARSRRRARPSVPARRAPASVDRALRRTERAFRPGRRESASTADHTAVARTFRSRSDGHHDTRRGWTKSSLRGHSLEGPSGDRAARRLMTGRALTSAWIRGASEESTCAATSRDHDASQGGVPPTTPQPRTAALHHRVPHGLAPRRARSSHASRP